jgi:hypothetical protein
MLKQVLTLYDKKKKTDLLSGFRYNKITVLLNEHHLVFLRRLEEKKFM